MCTYPAAIGLSMLVRFGDVVAASAATFEDGHTGTFDVGTFDVGDGGGCRGRGTGAAGLRFLIDIDIGALVGRESREEDGRPSGIDTIIGIVWCRRPLPLLELSEVARKNGRYENWLVGFGQRWKARVRYISEMTLEHAPPS